MGGVFSQAVAGNERGPGDARFQHTECCYGYGEDRRLRDFGQSKLIFGAFEADLRELVAESVVGFFEGLAGDGIFLGEIFAHADCLRALAGKERCDAVDWFCHDVKTKFGLCHCLQPQPG